MKIVGKHNEVLAEILIGEKEQKRIDIKKELRKEIKGMISKDKNMKDYIALFEKFTGLSYKSNKLTEHQLNDLVMFCINQQLSHERGLERRLNKW